MNTNFYELYFNGVCKEIRQEGTDVQTLAKRWVNDAVSDFMLRWPWRFAMKEGQHIANTSEHFISLPCQMGQILSIREKESNRDLSLLSAVEFHRDIPDPTYTGTPYIAVELGLSSVIKQPLFTIYAKSTDATADDIVTIVGDVDGLETSATITLSGTTPVPCTTYFNRIYKVSVSTAPATLYSVAITDITPTTFATIDAGDTVGTITAQPARPVTIQGSSTADTSSVGLVRISGYDGDGIYIEESLTMNGATAVNSTNYFNSIEQNAKSAVTTGVFTVSSASPSRTLAKIAPTELEAQFIRIGLYPIPSEPINLFIRYKAIPRKMVLDSDTFWPIPAEYKHIVLEKALSNAWDFMKLPDRGSLCRQNYEQYIAIAKQDDSRRMITERSLGGSSGFNRSQARGFSYPKNVSESTT